MKKHIVASQIAVEWNDKPKLVTLDAVVIVQFS